MNLLEYVSYLLISKLQDKLTSATSKLKNGCSHTYPNGKSALKSEEYYDQCLICGQSITTGNYYEEYSFEA